MPTKSGLIEKCPHCFPRRQTPLDRLCDTLSIIAEQLAEFAYDDTTLEQHNLFKGASYRIQSAIQHLKAIRESEESEETNG